jgi:hypothetical protein
MVGNSEVMAEVALGPGKRANRTSEFAPKLLVRFAGWCQWVDATLGRNSLARAIIAKNR